MGSINLLEARRNILMSQPHLTTESANPLTFQTDISANLKDCKIYFEPIQEGSGNPSPDNVRPISGWDGVELYINNTSLTIPFPQTIYGGYVDLVKGEVVEEWVGFTFDGVNCKANYDYMSNTNKYIRAYWVYWSPRGTNLPSKKISVICDKLPVVRNDSTGISSTPCLYAAGNGTVFGGLVLGTKEDYPDLAEGTKVDRISAVNAWFADNPTTVVYSKSEQDTKTTYQLTPETIKTLKGTNNIWSDANGNIEVKFWKH